MTPIYDDAQAAGYQLPPTRARLLLEEAQAPPRLVAHLIVVSDVAAQLCNFIELTWAKATFDRELAWFGAATHDIGKAWIPEVDLPVGLFQPRFLKKLANAAAAVRVLLEEIRILRNDEPFRRLQGSPGGIRSLKG